MNTQPKKCLCGAPVAKQSESPVAMKAGLCKACFELYLKLGPEVVQQVIGAKP